MEHDLNNEQIDASRQADASPSSQSFPEIRQLFAAYHPAEAQHESTSQQADARRQGQIEQRQSTIVQRHEVQDQEDPSIQETAKQHLRDFLDNLKENGVKLHAVSASLTGYSGGRY